MSQDLFIPLKLFVAVNKISRLIVILNIWFSFNWFGIKLLGFSMYISFSFVNIILLFFISRPLKILNTRNYIRHLYLVPDSKRNILNISRCK